MPRIFQTYSSIALVAALFLAACSSQEPDHPVRHSGLSVEDVSVAGELAFSILQRGRLYEDYGVSHTRQMHLIVVRDDLRHFEHLHPVLDAQGVWRVPYNAPAGGTYWIFADFVDATGMHYVLRFERMFLGEEGEYGMTADDTNVAQIGRYFVNMSPRVSPDAVAFEYEVTDSRGTRVALEDYLGGKGHSVLISSTGEYMHSHPMDMDGENPVFMTDVPRGQWRIFTQFQVDGDVITAGFDWLSERDAIPSSAGGGQQERTSD